MSKIKKAQIDKQSKITAQILRERFIYDPKTGEWFKKTRVDHHDCDRGYRILSMYIEGKRCYVKAHRAAFLYMNSKFPENDVDHIDMDKSNNKWENLREATTSQNLSNMRKFKSNTSGYKGVHKRKCDGKYVAYIGHNNMKIHLGTFETAELAYKAYCDKSDELHKEFSRKT